MNPCLLHFNWLLSRVLSLVWLLECHCLDDARFIFVWTGIRDAACHKIADVILYMVNGWITEILLYIYYSLNVIKLSDDSQIVSYEIMHVCSKLLQISHKNQMTLLEEIMNPCWFNTVQVVSISHATHSTCCVTNLNTVFLLLIDCILF